MSRVPGPAPRPGVSSAYPPSAGGARAMFQQQTHPTVHMSPPVRFAGLVTQQPGVTSIPSTANWFPTPVVIPNWPMQQDIASTHHQDQFKQAKVEEQQRREEDQKLKERHFLQQQQRLKAMGISRREPLNADTLIESMFSKKEDFLPKGKHVASGKSGQTSSAPEKIGLPSWLMDPSLAPESYKKVYEYVGEDNSMVDTHRLTQLLAYSNLPRETLGFLWTLVNRQVPGQLTQQELYLLLALVAAVQAGYAFNDLNILQKFPHPIIPAFNSPPQSQQQASNSQPEETQEEEEEFSDFQSAVSVRKEPPLVSKSSRDLADTTFSPVLQPKFPHSQTSIVGSRLANYDLGVGQNGDKDSVAKNAMSPVGQMSERKTSEGEFSDFQKAGQVKSRDDDSGDKYAALRTISWDRSSTQVAPANEDLLLGNEDKYSVFRQFEDVKAEGIVPSGEKVVAEETNNNMLPAGSKPFVEEKLEDDDFGDFLSGPPVVPSPSFKADFTDLATSQKPPFQPGNWAMKSDLGASVQSNFADFIATVEAHEKSKTALETIDYRDPLGEFQEAESNNAQVTVANNANNDDDDDFGDFLGPSGAQAATKIQQVSPESQSVSSLDLGFETSSHCCNLDKGSLSRQGSLPSLDLKISGSLGGDLAEGGGGGGGGGANSADEFGGLQSAMAHLAIGDKSLKFGMPGPLGDKYSAVREDVMQNEDRHTYEWGRCLQSCLELIQYAVTIFNSVSSSQVVKEVLGTEEGSSYLSNVVEVYRVACRIGLSYRKHSSESKLQSILTEIDGTWDSLKPFIIGTIILPEEAAFDFSSGVLSPEPENLQKACGVCLLDTDGSSKAFNRTEDCQKLMYGGRQYHASCANLWVNCVDSILPALPFIFLL